MKRRRIFGIAGIIIGIAVLTASGFHWWMVLNGEPYLKGIDVGAHPEFGFASIEDWKRAALTPVLAFALFGAASIFKKNKANLTSPLHLTDVPLALHTGR